MFVLQRSNVLPVKNINRVWTRARPGRVRTAIITRKAPARPSEKNAFVKVVQSCTGQTPPSVSQRTNAVRVPHFFFVCKTICFCHVCPLMLFTCVQCVRTMTVLRGPLETCGTVLCAAAVCSSVWRTAAWCLWNPSAVMNPRRCVRGRASTQSTCWRKEYAARRRSVV